MAQQTSPPSPFHLGETGWEDLGSRPAGHHECGYGAEQGPPARDRAGTGCDHSAWYRMLDLAGVCDTLVADADGVYHPALFNDRLILG